MQNCENTKTNLQVMTKGNQIKNFSKKRIKTPNIAKIHSQKAFDRNNHQSGQKPKNLNQNKDKLKTEI